MLQRSKLLFISWLLIAVAMISVLLSNGCRNRVLPGEGESDDKLTGEPDHYSATIVRTIDDGSGRAPTITREARLGEQRREEWTEQGQNRALIWRPDLGKSYLLDLDRQAFVEIDLAGGNQTLHDDAHLQDRASNDSTDGLVQAVDRALDDAPSPDLVETRMLPISEIGGHLCKVYERRATFPDGHTEITKTFRARDLGGLALRIESGSAPASVSVITERKDVVLDVASDAFTVPANFKRVDRLER
jgi:hypothetical protein